YQLDPDFLRRCAPLFGDERVGFIQAPQDYRDWAQAPYFRRLYYSYKYFFSISQPSRNGHDGADPPLRAGVRRWLGRVVHHRGRRAVPPGAARRLVRVARGRLVRPGRDAAD